VFEVPEKPYQKEVVDSLKPDDDLVGYPPPSANAALCGGILSTAAKARGAPGVVLEGITRDEPQVAGMAFPAFASGISPLDVKGRLGVFVYRCTIECGGCSRGA
jgi:4-hydroxy-4-methyl-2-oxoglutarate aldolase